MTPKWIVLKRTNGHVELGTPVAEVYSNKEEAIAYAEAQAQKYNGTMYVVACITDSRVVTPTLVAEAVDTELFAKEIGSGD